jgi:hypothetical protein
VNEEADESDECKVAEGKAAAGQVLATAETLLGGRGIPGAGVGGASVTPSASLVAITTMLVLIFVLRFVAQAEGMAGR